MSMMYSEGGFRGFYRGTCVYVCMYVCIWRASKVSETLYTGGDKLSLHSFFGYCCSTQVTI